MVQKSKTDIGSSRSTSTLQSLMLLKQNEGKCFERELTPDQCKRWKSATNRALCLSYFWPRLLSQGVQSVLWMCIFRLIPAESPQLVELSSSGCVCRLVDIHSQTVISSPLSQWKWNCLHVDMCFDSWRYVYLCGVNNYNLHQAGENKTMVYVTSCLLRPF